MTEHTAEDQSSTDLVEAPLGFHAKDGYHFLRTEDSGVRIVVVRGERRHVVDFDCYTWASIMASVSAYGETSDSYHAAQDFHDGDAVLAQSIPDEITLNRLAQRFYEASGITLARMTDKPMIVEGLRAVFATVNATPLRRFEHRPHTYLPNAACCTPEVPPPGFRTVSSRGGPGTGRTLREWLADFLHRRP